MQPLSELRVHPVDLSGLGTTPSGAAMYRVVWSDSRKSVAYRGDKQIVTDKYQHGAESDLRGKWILEKWLPASVYYGMTAEKWDALQKVALEQPKYSAPQQSAIGSFLKNLPADMRRQVESNLGASKPEPVIEPYSHEGEFEFAGLYFSGYVDEAFLKKQVAAHVHKLQHTTDTDRQVEREEKDAAQKIADDKSFDVLFDETREAAMSAA